MPDPADTPVIVVSGFAARMLEYDADPADQPVPYTLTPAAETALDEAGWP
jgi:hypothetical protein